MTIVTIAKKKLCNSLEISVRMDCHGYLGFRVSLSSCLYFSTRLNYHISCVVLCFAITCSQYLALHLGVMCIMHVDGIVLGKLLSTYTSI